MEKSISTEKVSNHIHNDIAFSILSKLPLKSLKRFSCVHKSWSRLFENPNFMNMYRNNVISSEDDGSCLLLQQTLPYPHYHSHMLYLLSGERFENKVKLGSPTPFRKSDNPGFILGPVINGIVCLYQSGTNVVLWNPTNGEFKVLPESPTELEPSVRYEIELERLHGFGYDSVSDDYKVIRHVQYELNLSDYENDDSDFEGDALSDYESDAVSLPTSMSRDDVWEIYSLRSNSWRKLDLDMPCGMRTSVGVYVYLNGACHWWDDDDDDDNDAYLVSFDLSKEVVCITPMPSTKIVNFDSGLEMRHLTVLNDHIALISYFELSATFHISILGEVGVKESWTKLFILTLPGIHHPIGEGRNGDLFFRRDDNKLVWFNLRTQMMEELGIKGQMHCCQVVIYKESHLSLGGLNG
ncbi:putative F-box domain-containing protein [Medicago truncatula]|uniref:F-box protein interaction domain protein n=2 Tax=Medicago truncatula TaxID=3880 RepID=A0A072TGC3_MEDTR|nr:F-box protein interaction domain protein [Medicago truncatula]RHN52678.1 putative F-box domain-containing protein [Medicago truncatula]